jgi:murein L,D-transpeptidase YafK
MADLLAARAGARNLISSYSEDENQLLGLRDELRYRWEHNLVGSPAQAGLMPSNMLQASPDQEYTLVVDAGTARLYVYRNSNGTHTLVDDFFMTVGKLGMGKELEGDLRTPVGVYFVTSYLPGQDLPDRYGPGAFPINYPNIIDKRKIRTGFGIWIHGTESENHNRVPLASDGCVSLNNDDFLQISKYVDIDGSTPVIIADKIVWVEPRQITTTQAAFFSLLNRWKIDWESLDHDNYMRHYSQTDFERGEDDYEKWAAYTKQVNSAKKYIRVEIDNLSIFTYPGEKNMVMMSFNQAYQSNNYKSNSRKSLFWQQDTNGQWKIIYEG